MSYGEDWPVGTVISWNGVEYRIRFNGGNSGSVEYLDGQFVSSQFYWSYQGINAVLVSLPSGIEA